MKNKLNTIPEAITAIKNGDAPDGDLVALAGLRSKHNTYMSVPLLWTIVLKKNAPNPPPHDAFREQKGSYSVS